MPTPEQLREQLLARMHDALRSTFGEPGLRRLDWTTCSSATASTAGVASPKETTQRLTASSIAGFDGFKGKQEEAILATLTGETLAPPP